MAHSSGGKALLKCLCLKAENIPVYLLTSIHGSPFVSVFFCDLKYTPIVLRFSQPDPEFPFFPFALFIFDYRNSRILPIFPFVWRFDQCIFTISMLIRGPSNPDFFT